MTIERVHLGDGLEISRALTGLWQIADMERGGETLDPDATAAAMEPYVAAGLTTFDMADHYGSAEVIAGHYRARFGDRAQLLTKWVPEPGRPSRDGVRAAVTRAMDRLQTDRIDLLQFHAWNYADPSYLDALTWLQELKAEGQIRNLGVTNFDTAHLDLLTRSGLEIVSNQICFSLLDRRALRGMTALCAARGIHILAFGTLGGGLLTERWLGRTAPEPGELTTWSQQKYHRFVAAAGGWDAVQNVLRVVAEVARKNGVSMANVASRYVLDQPAVAGVILGARLGASAHIEDNLRLFEFSLTDADRTALDAVLAALDPIPGDCGDEYRKPPFLTASGDLSHHLDTMPAPYSTVTGPDGRTRADSGTPWEELAGFSRAVRVGDRILVSGTTATHGDRPIGGRNPAAQMNFVIDKIEGAIQSLGGRLQDVVRTRILIQNESDWEAVSRVHGVRFASIRPANTLVAADVIGNDYLVEMEAEAIIGAGR